MTRDKHQAIGLAMREVILKEAEPESSWATSMTPGGRTWWVLRPRCAMPWWSTPNTQDARGAGSLRTRLEGRQMQLHQQVKLTAPGAAPGLLNPLWVGQVMGAPDGWLDARAV